MSKQVDQRVVEMRFDNKHFERNVATTMSTLEKFNRSLQFKDAEKGFDNLNASAKKVDMTHLGKGLETVRAKFSALEVMGVTALANITNSAINAGKNIVKSLTVAPVMDGFNEYEMTLNAVQTTMAGTGKTAEQVEQQLKKLDEYADKTVYSTSDMLNNLPKFTNAGVELEKATTAMIGIANATALAGGDAGKASIAFYNLGQAIGTGYLSRMDYNSINNAGIATMEWKNQMVEAAIAQGTLTKVGEDSYKSGEKTYTLQQLFIDGLQTQWATTDVLMEVFEDYGDETTDIGKKSYSAAQDIKTFSQMMESLKATAGTGWKDTWQLIFGGLDEAKEFWTGLSNFISGIITKMADIRNNLLEGALGKTFTGLSEKLGDILQPAKKAAETIEGATKAVKDLGNIVDRVIGGEFGNGQKRFEALTKAGYNWAEVQNKVNEKLGSSKRYSVELGKAQDDLTESQKESSKEQSKLSETEAKRIEQLCEMSEAELESLGYTKEQIKAFKELKTEADKLGMSVSDFIANIDELDGRTILINSFKNIGQGLVTVFESIKDAWVDIFPPATSEQLYNIIAGFHKLSTHLVVGDDTADKLTRTFKGLFAALDLILTVVGGPVKIAFKAFTKILGAFDLDILDVTAAIGDAIVRFSDWIDSILDFTKIFEKIEPALSKSIDAVKKWVENVKSYIADLIPNIGEILSNLPAKIAELFGNLKSMMPTVAQDMIAGLANGIADGAKTVWNAVVSIGKKILEAICKVLGINSPSKETYDIGKNVTQGLANGIFAGASGVLTAIKDMCSKVIESVKNANWSDISATLSLLGSFFTKIPGLKQITALATYFKNVGVDSMKGLFDGLSAGGGSVIDFITNLGKNLIESICNVLDINSPSKVMFAIGGFLIAGLIGGIAADSEGVLDTFKDIGKNLILTAKDMVMGLLDFLKNISPGEIITLALIGGVIVAIKKAIDIIDAFAGAAKGFQKAASGIGDLTKALANRIDPKKNKFEDAANNMLKMAAAIGILAGSVYLLAQLDAGKLWGAVGAVTALALVIGGLAIAMDKLQVKGTDFGKITLLILGIAGAMLMISKMMKTLGGMEWSEFGKAATGLGGLLAFLTMMMLITKVGNAKGIGKMLIQISIAMGILVFIGKSIAKMEWSEMGKAAAGLGGLVAFMALLMLVTKIGNAKKVGGMLLKMAGAIAILTLVVKMIAKMEWSEMGKAAIGLAGLGGFLVGLMYITKIGNFKKVGSMLMQVAGAIAILAVTAKIIATMEWSEMGKAGVGILGLSVIIAGLMMVTKYAGGNDLNGVGKTLLAASTAIAILAGVCVVLGMVDPGRLKQGLLAVTTLGVLMGILILATERAQKCTGTLWALTASIAVLAGAVVALSFIEPSKLTGATIALSVVMGMMALLAYSTGNIKSSTGSILALAGVVALLTGAIWLVANCPAGTALPAALALSAVMLALAGSLLIISNVKNVSVSAMTAIALIGASVLALAGALAIVAAIPTDSILPAAIALGVIMLALSASLAIVSNFGGGGAVAGAASLLIVAAALLVLTPALQALGNMSLAQIGTALLAVVGALVVLGGAAVLLGPVAPVMILIAGAIALLGAGCLAAGAGTLMFVQALTQFMMLAMTMVGQGPIIAAGITAMITGICTAIITSSAAISAAIIAVVTAICTVLVTTTPMIMQTLLVMITSFLNLLVQAIPKFVVAGMQIIQGILQGIADNIGGIIDAATDIIVAFLDGIARNVGRVIDSGIKLMIAFINGLADGIRNNTSSMLNAVDNLMDAVMGAIKAWFGRALTKGKELVGKLVSGVKSKFADFKGAAKDMMDGFIKGVSEKFGAIKQKAVDAVKGAVDAVKNFLGINSPSKLFASFGRYTDEGFIVGLQKYSKDVYNAGMGVGQSVTKGVRDSLDINSPSKVMKENGAYVVQGIAEGIKEDTSAEDAARQKAQNITNAFKTEFDKVDLDVKTADLEYKLWESANPSATEADKLKAQVSTINRKIEEQTERVSLAQGEYQVTLAEFGENAEETQSAYNKLLQERIDLNSLMNSLNDTQKDLIEKQNELTEAQNSYTEEEFNAYNKQRQSVIKYNEYLKEHRDGLLAVGLTMDEIRAAATKASGYDPNASSVETPIGSTPANMSNAGTAMLTSYGTEATASITDGIQNGKPQVTEAMNTMVTGCVDQLKSRQPDWKQAGEYLVSGFVEGIRDNIESAARAAAQMARAAMAAAMDELDINSPSRVFAEMGMYVDEGFANGITKYARVAKNAAVSMSKDTVEAVRNPLSRMMDLINGDLDTTPTIRPVLDLSEIRSGATQISGIFGQRSVALAGINARIANVEQLRKTNDLGNSDIVRAISELRGDFSNLANAVNNMQITMDGKTVVGTLINKIDSQLGQIVNHKGRGN